MTRQDASHSDSGHRSCRSESVTNNNNYKSDSVTNNSSHRSDSVTNNSSHRSDSVTNNSSFKRDSVTRNAASSGNAECGPNLGMETGRHSLPVTHRPGDSLSVTHLPEDSLSVTHCSGDSLSVTHSNDGGGKSLKEGNRESDADAGTRIKTYLRQLSASETSVLGQIVRWAGEEAVWASNSVGSFNIPQKGRGYNNMRYMSSKTEALISSHHFLSSSMSEAQFAQIVFCSTWKRVVELVKFFPRNNECSEII